MLHVVVVHQSYIRRPTGGTTELYYDLLDPQHRKPEFLRPQYATAGEGGGVTKMTMMGTLIV